MDPLERELENKSRICTYLLLSDLGEVPDVEPAVGAGGGEDGLVVRRPLHLEADNKLN